MNKYNLPKSAPTQYLLGKYVRWSYTNKKCKNLRIKSLRDNITKDDSLFQLVEVLVDYVKVPQFIRLTQEQIDLTEDTSQIMEFPDYVNQEIINELVHLVMERTADPRLQTNLLMSQSIARPTGQLQRPQLAQQL